MAHWRRNPGGDGHESWQSARCQRGRPGGEELVSKMLGVTEMPTLVVISGSNWRSILYVASSALTHAHTYQWTQDKG